MTTTTIAGQPGDVVPAALDPPSGDLDAPVENLVEGVQLRSIVFPVAGPVTYSDDFGNCRDLCDRRHAGNDIVGLRLQPLLAAADGVVDHLVDNHPTAGWGVVVRDTEGWEYRYFHLNNDTPGTDDGLDDGTWRFAPGVGPGVAVQAGQILGWMGDSGNSESSVPHLHFEIRRPDGKAVNPFASLRWAQRLQQCLSPNGPFADMLFPIPEPAHEVELALPAGQPADRPSRPLVPPWSVVGWSATPASTLSMVPAPLQERSSPRPSQRRSWWQRIFPPADRPTSTPGCSTRPVSISEDVRVPDPADEAEPLVHTCPRCRAHRRVRASTARARRVGPSCA